MKATLKRLLKAAWRKLAPIRRPIVRKFDNHLWAVLAPLVETSVRPGIEAVLDERVRGPLDEARGAAAQNLERIDAFLTAATRAAHETDLVLNSLVREVVRLQMQVEYLQQLVPALDTDESGDACLVGADGPRGGLARTSTAERAMVG